MHINDRLDDGQPETGPFISVLPGWITAVEAIEELWQLLCWNLLTGVLDTDGGRAQVLLQPHCDNVPGRRITDCVGEEVADGAAQQLPIGLDRCYLPPCLQRDALIFHPGLEILEQPLDRFGQV